MLLYCKSLIKQSSFGVEERIILFYVESPRKNYFGFRTFEFLNGLQDRITFENRGTTVHANSVPRVQERSPNQFLGKPAKEFSQN